MQLFALKIIHLFLTLNFESFRTFPLPETRSFLGSFKWLFSHILSCLHKQSLNLEQTWTWIKDPCLTFWHGGLVFFLNHLPSITVRYASTESAPTSTSQQSFRMQRAWRRFAKKCTHTLYIYVRNGRNTDFPLLSMDRSKMGIPELIDKGQGLNLLGCWPFHFQDAVPKMKMLVVSKMKMRNRSETSHQKWCLKKVLPNVVFSFYQCLLPLWGLGNG